MGVVFRFSILAVIALLSSAPQAFAGQEVKLGSGKSVEILGVGPLQPSQGPRAIMLKYRTLLPLNDVPALRVEVDEIWDRFVIDVERAGYQSAVISANEPEKGDGIVTTNAASNFLFERKDGAWRSPDWPPGTQASLTPEIVRQFMDRANHAYEHGEVNALQLMTASDWIGTSVRTKPPGQQTVDWPGLQAIVRVLATASNRHYQRDIAAVTITNNGSAATVESREIESFVLNGRELEFELQSTDRLEIRGNALLMVESKSIVLVETETRSN